MEMELQLKYDLIEKIVQSEDEVLLQQVRHLLDEQETNDWSKIDSSLKQSLNRALIQSEANEVRSHTVVMKEIKARFKK